MTKLSIAHTVAFNGIDVIPIEVQVYIGDEMPAFIISGLGDKAIVESKERIKSALKCIGLALPNKRIVINLSPANLPKEGSHYDLPISLSILVALGILSQSMLDEFIVIGELSLNGNLIKTSGALLSSIHASSKDKKLICPYDSYKEVAVINSNVVPVKNILDIIHHIKGDKICDVPKVEFKEINSIKELDMADVIGNDSAKRALEIAAAGGHHVLMVGAPGVGKSMLAMRMLGIMPKLSLKESIETSLIYSVAGMLENGLKQQRPFRDPHHNTSVSAMLGGGKNCQPGEISLAHRGILFIDEITLWPPTVLNGLRESLETGYISIARANSHVQYPAKSQIIAAMNPCPCGKAFEPTVSCTKLPICMQNYINKIPGPIMDRFSIIIQINQSNPWELQKNCISESSANIRKRVEQARSIQLERYKDYNFLLNNEVPSSNHILDFESIALQKLDNFASYHRLSSRKYFNLQRVCRTIADLGNDKQIKISHVIEGCSYILQKF